MSCQGRIPDKFVKPEAGCGYVKRAEMIPMRDGVKPYTVMRVPTVTVMRSAGEARAVAAGGFLHAR